MPGLKHSHSFIGGAGAYQDDVGVATLPVSANRDSLEFTVMSYRSYVGQDLDAIGYYTNEAFGFPQTLMMLDIAALQHAYGADFTTNSGDSIYTFSPTTGQMSVNGSQGQTPGANRIFMTMWMAAQRHLRPVELHDEPQAGSPQAAPRSSRPRNSPASGMATQPPRTSTTRCSSRAMSAP